MKKEKMLPCRDAHQTQLHAHEAEALAKDCPDQLSLQGVDRRLEALLFAADTPCDRKTLASFFPEGTDLEAALKRLESHYEDRGVILRYIAGGYRFVTAPDLAGFLRDRRRTSKRLSRAALETLTIIAYHQPCTRAQIESIRGVSTSSGTLTMLFESGWVEIAGRRKEAPGRPLLLATTQAFLEYFGLGGLEDLPDRKEMEAMGLGAGPLAHKGETHSENCNIEEENERHAPSRLL